MIPPPIAIGLFLCQQFDRNSTTQTFSMIDIIWRLELPTVPASAPPFIAVAGLNGGNGSGLVQVAVYRPDTNDLVYGTGRWVTFPDRLSTVYVPFRIGHCQFPVAGRYEFQLLVDHDIVAQQSLYIEVGGQP